MDILHSSICSYNLINDDSITVYCASHVCVYCMQHIRIKKGISHRQQNITVMASSGWLRAPFKISLTAQFMHMQERVIRARRNVCYNIMMHRRSTQTNLGTIRRCKARLLKSTSTAGRWHHFKQTICQLLYQRDDTTLSSLEVYALRIP